jgi:hypothetical protein
MTGPAPSPFPLQLELDAPLKVARWRLLAIPHIIVLYALSVVGGIVYFISWFAILFTGKMPEGFFGVQCMVMRYQWRVQSYLFFMRETYPPFTFDTVGPDPGTDPARVSYQPAARLSRGLIFVKWLLVIPHFFVLFVLMIGVFFVEIAGFFAVLITGTWPEGMRRYLIGVIRWGHRVSMYMYLMTDQYPPFSLD